MNTSTLTHDNTGLLVTYNHWLKKAYPMALSSMQKLGLCVEFRTFKNKDTIIDPKVMLSIVDTRHMQVLYSWNGKHSLGSVSDFKDMAHSMWQGMPAMLAMLRARHAYIAMVTTDLPPATLDVALCDDESNTLGNWTFDTHLEHQDIHQTVDDRGLDRLKEIYEAGSKPALHQMVGTQAVLQITKVQPLKGSLPADEGNHRAVGDKDDLEVTLGVEPHGLSFTLKDYWMELNYGWESAGLVAVMSWQALKDTFGLEETKFNMHYNMNDGDAKDALCKSLEPVPNTPTNELPQGFDQP